MTYLAVLVCGSRTLSGNRARREGIREYAAAYQVEKDARAWLWDRLGLLCGGDRRNIVIDGGAEGPDSWANEDARSLGLAWDRFHADGRDEYIGGSVPPWREPVREAKVWEHFQQRNQFMLDRLRDLRQAENADVCVIALLDPWSETKGAVWTAKRAREMGLNVEEWNP